MYTAHYFIYQYSSAFYKVSSKSLNTLNTPLECHRLAYKAPPTFGTNLTHMSVASFLWDIGKQYIGKHYIVGYLETV